MTTAVAPSSIWDTAALSAWVAGLPHGITYQLLPRVYDASRQPFTIASKFLFTLDWNGATLQQHTDGTEQLDGTQATANRVQARSLAHFNDCVIWNLKGSVKLLGANTNAGLGDAAYNPALSAQHGLWVDGGSWFDWSAQTAYVDKVFGDYAYVGGTHSAPHDFLLTRVWGNTNGRQGISICRYGGNGRVQHNVLMTSRRSLFDIEPLPGWASGANGLPVGLDISANLTGPHRENFLSSQGYDIANDVDCHDNQDHSGGAAGALNVYVKGPQRRSNWKFRNNTTDHTYGSAAGHVRNYYDIDGITDTGNVQPVQKDVVHQAVFNDCTAVTYNETPA
jgi:hypothetical protein